MFHRSAIEAQNACHVGAVKLQEALEEHCWAWLILHKLKNVTQSVADIATLEEEKLSQGDCMDPDAVDVFETGLVASFCVFFDVLLSDVNYFDVSGELKLD